MKNLTLHSRVTSVNEDLYVWHSNMCNQTRNGYIFMDIIFDTFVVHLFWKQSYVCKALL